MANQLSDRSHEDERDQLERRANSTPGRHDPANYDPIQVQSEDERTQREWELAARDVSGRLLDQPEDPSNFGVCLYVAHDAPGDQVATFHWFETRDDLFDWVRSALPLNARRYVAGDANALRRRVGSIVDAVVRRQLDAAPALQELNGLLEPYCTLEWWGSFHDLLASPNEFERTLRLWYRETREDEEGIELEWGDDPIAAEEIDQFVETLGHYR